MQPILRIPTLIAGCLMCIANAAAQTGTEPTVTDLTEVTVRHVKLLPAAMLDSVIAHRAENYPAFKYFSGTMDARITASGTGDTLYYASRPVWLERAQFGVYSVYGRKGDTARLVNLATPAQTDRVITIKTYPQQHGIGALMESMRDALKKHDAFYGTSFRGEQRILHIIMPVDAKPGHWLTRKLASQFSADTVIAYLSLEIGQDDWSLLRQEWISISTDGATAQRFREARRYTVLNGLLQKTLAQPGARYLRSVHSFVPAAGRRGYRPALNEFEDNLYNLSKQIPKRGENDEASIFRTRIVIDGAVAALPDEELVEAKSGDFVEGAAFEARGQ